MGKKRIDPDTLWDRPITREGADLLAHRYGYRLAGFLGEPHLAYPDLSYLDDGRYMAVFWPDPDDGVRGVIMADGRTRNRALRRGLEACRAGAFVEEPS